MGKKLFILSMFVILVILLAGCESDDNTERAEYSGHISGDIIIVGAAGAGDIYNDMIVLATIKENNIYYLMSELAEINLQGRYYINYAKINQDLTVIAWRDNQVDGSIGYIDNDDFFGEHLKPIRLTASNNYSNTGVDINMSLNAVSIESLDQQYEVVNGPPPWYNLKGE